MHKYDIINVYFQDMFVDKKFYTICYRPYLKDMSRAYTTLV